MISMVKTFQNDSLSSLEDSINEFLVNHKDDPTYSQPTDIRLTNIREPQTNHIIYSAIVLFKN